MLPHTDRCFTSAPDSVLRVTKQCMEEPGSNTIHVTWLTRDIPR